MTNQHRVVSRTEWLTERKELLAREKHLTHLREEIAAQRRQLPWVKLDTSYVFEGPAGKESLSDLFAGRSQLIVQHLMFAPDREAACAHCSFWSDSYNGTIAHIQQRDVTFVATSRAPFAKLQAFQKRMGWTFKWLSSAGNGFERDFGVTFTPEELASGVINYNYGTHKAYGADMPGISVFAKDGDDVFHTYSTYARGIDAMNNAYQYLDLVPKGRDEGGRPMHWVKHRDRYDAQ